jgi:hypothetical protein
VPQGRTKLGAGSDQNKQRRERTALGNSAQKIKRGRVGPMQILDRQDQRLNARTHYQPVGQRC